MTDLLKIYKYRLPFHDTMTDVVTVTVQVGDLLHLAMQDGEIHVWAAVDPGSVALDVRFHLVGTGSYVDPSWYHLGTVIDGDFVWHVFTEPNAQMKRLAVTHTR